MDTEESLLNFKCHCIPWMGLICIWEGSKASEGERQSGPPDGHVAGGQAIPGALSTQDHCPHRLGVSGRHTDTGRIRASRSGQLQTEPTALNSEPGHLKKMSFMLKEI